MTNRLRVCEVVKTLDIGGTEVLLVERLKTAPCEQIDYTVVCLRRTTEELIDALRAAGISVVDLSGCPRPLMYARLAATVGWLKPDVVNAHSPIPAIVLRLATRLRRRRPSLVRTVHSVTNRPATLFLDRITRRLDDETVAVSPAVAAAAAVTKGARRVSVRVHGVNTGEQQQWAAAAAAVRREFAVPPESFLISFVANLLPLKGHDVLLEAAAEVVRSRPEALFLLAGQGPARERIIQDIERHHLGGHVRLLGLVPWAKRLIAASDLLVLSSRWEGLPVVIMEALAAGVPVVAPAVGGIPDLVRPGVNGFLTEPGSAGDLAAGILRAMEPDTRRRLREGAAEGAGRLDMVHTARWFEELYCRLKADA
ncbi:glycosyltransferase [Nonomuraea sp. NBC_01738]|uniref:glycosyltransferase n=1 Tax=Nonomuraea sp. NBC_01738 TaxID=2976003 RepID=UPI002E130EBD|nr:glycosyltransferase [Nonomuraea sp. NBC_01738]